MGWIDVIEAAPEFLSRRWKSAVILVLFLVFWLFPNAAQDLVAWYVREKTGELLQILLPSLQQPAHVS